MTETVTRRVWLWLVASMGLGLPACVLVAFGVHLDPRLTVVLFGIGIVGGAFLLSWAAEVAQLDVSASLAIAMLALIAILPEYSIEAVLAWKAGASLGSEVDIVTPEMARVAANVTGANRLLIGVGWSTVVLIYCFRRKRPLDVRGSMSLELITLTVATLLSFVVFFMGQVQMVVAGVMISIYLIYLLASSTQGAGEPELTGVSRLIGSLPKTRRLTVVAMLFLYAAGVILVAAEPFVDSLVDTGLEMGIDEFVLIQWIAPLASEAPEIVVAVLFSLRANPLAGMTTLVSAQVNQLTLLIGSMVVIFSLSAGQPLNFGLEARQATEFFLTSAMSLFAILLIAPRVIGWKSGMVLLLLFLVHLFFVDESERKIFAYGFLLLSLVLVVSDRSRVRNLVRLDTKKKTPVHPEGSLRTSWWE